MQMQIIMHSTSGASLKLSRQLSRGAACVDDINIRQCWADELLSDDIARADLIVFVFAEYLGHCSGSIKAAIERSFYQLSGDDFLKSYALLISAGNDGTNADRELQRMLSGFPMKQIAQSCIVKGDPTEDDLMQIYDLGEALATGLSMGIY